MHCDISVRRHKKINHDQTKKKKKRKKRKKQTNKNKTCTNFTYYSPKIRTVTNLFKRTNIGIAFKNTNTLQQLTKPKSNNKTPEHDKNGIYKLTCNTCHRSYIGQISHSFKQRFEEHTRYIKHSEPQSAYALHILNNKHEYGPIKDTMTLLKHIEKPSLVIPYVQLYIQLYHHNNQLFRSNTQTNKTPCFNYSTTETTRHTPPNHVINTSSLYTTKPVPSQPGQQTVNYKDTPTK